MTIGISECASSPGSSRRRRASIPPVQRAARVKVRAQNEKGEWFEMDGEELLARAFQHEIDHLDGILFIFRMSALKRSLNLRKIRKMQREGIW